MNWYLTALKKYADFSGRARRKEYWYFVLFNVLASIILSLLDLLIGTQINVDQGSTVGILSSLYSLGILLPSLAVTVRRLHDTNHSGWWILISLVPLIGSIVLLVFLVNDSTPGDNPYGPNPKAVQV